MPLKLSFEYVKNFIDKEQLLISTKYNNNKDLLEIKCNICNEIYEQTFDRYNRGHRHQKCSNRSNRPVFFNTETSLKALQNRFKNKIFLKDTIRICELCKKEYNPKRFEQKLCGMECMLIFSKTDETRKEKAKIHGSIGGQISAENQQRRSKNEILFSELCIEYFGEDDIICNQRIFKDKKGGAWDADAVILSLKIACLWDGNWHFKKLNKKHNLEHVQLRDKWKREIIIDNGYTYYTIKDLGGFNPKFVKEQFDLFIHKLHFKQTLVILNK